MIGLAVFCSDKIDFRSRQEQSCPTTADETTPYPHPISENSSANGCSRNFELLSFFRVFIKTFLAHVPPGTRLERVCTLEFNSFIGYSAIQN